MARIAGVNLDNNRPIFIALTGIYGIGQSLAKKILAEAGINPATRAKEISDADIARVKDIIEGTHAVEGELRMIIGQNIKRLRDINAYRGSRHARKLPVRGQRTKTNARTKRGKRVTVGSGRKPASQKT